MTKEELMQKAIEVSKNSYSPYSKFPVGACLLTDKGNTYVGCNFENGSLGMTICAERNAMFQMITNGEDEIKRVLAVMPDGKTGAPCGACREFMTQLMPDKYKDVQIMLDYDNEKIVTLGELTPEWLIYSYF